MFTSKIGPCQTTHYFIVHGRVHRFVIYFSDELQPPIGMPEKNMDRRECIFGVP